MTATTQERPAAPGKAAAKAAASDPTTAPRVIKPIPAAKARLAQFRRNAWTVFMPDDVHHSDLENPAIWTHAGAEFAMHDRVECIWSDRWAEGIVCDVGPAHARVRLLQIIDLPERRAGAATSLPPGYEIKQGSPGESPYIVIRLKDGWEMSKSHRFDRFEDARNWLLSLQIFKE
jgi:hypothetical protein